MAFVSAHQNKPTIVIVIKRWTSSKFGTRFHSIEIVDSQSLRHSSSRVHSESPEQTAASMIALIYGMRSDVMLWEIEQAFRLVKIDINVARLCDL